MTLANEKRVASALQLRFWRAEDRFWRAEDRFWRAEDRMLAARVPDGDRNGSTIEPITVSGYYEVPTKSGRKAWARIEWHNGRMREDHCTYDPDAERAANDLVIAGADPLWQDGGK